MGFAALGRERRLLCALLLLAPRRREMESGDERERERERERQIEVARKRLYSEIEI